MNDVRGALLAMAPFVMRFRLPRFVPRCFKALYWRVVLAGPGHVINGSLMVVPYELRGLLLAEYERHVVAFSRNVLRQGMTVCDVGANIGIFTLLAARLVGPRGRVTGIEPEPRNAACLRRNIALNRYGHVEVVQKAISEEAGEVTLHLSAYGGSHSVLPNPIRARGETVRVESVRLDSLPGMDHVDFLKVDVEGAELSVLRSLGAIRPATIVLEYHGERSRAGGTGGQEFLESLRGMGYTRIRNLDFPDVGLTRIEQGSEILTNLAAER